MSYIQVQYTSSRYDEYLYIEWNTNTVRLHSRLRSIQIELDANDE